MRLIPALSLTLLLSSASAQTALQPKTFSDPANLRGERVKPRDGRELPVDQGAAGLQQMLRRLGTRASIMNIVAHPDDEDGGMLTFYSRGVGARVADLSLTRGEGGQNAMTGDFEDALGLLRTQELLACDRYSGIDQFFGTEVDFGFSKSKEEAFGKWTHERVLYDVVRAVRLYRPLVLTATFIGGVTDGHGQHQVSGEIAQEVFKAAADPKIFPELTAEGILPWQPLKVYARVPTQSISNKGLFDYATGMYTQPRFENYVTGEVTTTAPSVDVVVHEGTTDPLLKDADGHALSYVQFARMGLAQQKSQTGPGMRMPGSGKFDSSFHMYGSRATPSNKFAEEATFFDGIDTSIQGIAELAPGAFPTGTLANLQRLVTTVAGKFDPMRPDAIAPDLATGLKQLDALIAEVVKWHGDTTQKESALHELRVKRVQFNDALALSLSPVVEATSAHADAVLGKDQTVHLHITTLPGAPLPPAVNLVDATGVADVEDGFGFNPKNAPPMDMDVNLSAKVMFKKITEPYFYRDNIEQSVYKLRDSSLRNAASTPAPLVAWSRYDYQGAHFDVGRIVHADRQAVQIVPSESLSLSAHAQVLPNDSESVRISANLRPMTALASLPQLIVPADWSTHAERNPDGLPSADQFVVVAPATRRSTITVKAKARELNQPIDKGYRAIGYEDLPRTNFYTPAEDTIVPVDLKLPAHRRIGYLPGTGDAVPEALASIGLKPQMLTLADINIGTLKNFDIVVLGVRTYGALPELHGAPTKALLDFARGGGNVVVQYQGAEFTGDDAPFPLTLGRDAERVVDETDPVQLLDPKSSLLSTPNHITSSDFDHWIEERGHGFLRSWDARYSALTEVHDPGEEPQKGGLITTQLGTGRWTYCAYAIYRQLPEAVPGAYRVFVNLLVK